MWVREHEFISRFTAIDQTFRLKWFDQIYYERSQLNLNNSYSEYIINYTSDTRRFCDIRS